MTPVGWMVGASAGSAVAAIGVFGRRAAVEILCGMLAPLVAATGSWVIAERTFRRNPERLTAVMIAAFGAKVVFFGAYVAVMLAVLGLRPTPFVVSFTGYFIGLYLIEALCLRRLFL
jgi:hypothetical protein